MSIEIIGLLVIGIIVVAFCYAAIRNQEERPKVQNRSAPYKIEPPTPTPTPAPTPVPTLAPSYNRPKRRYVKRSKYWITNKPAAKLKKARAAKKRK